MPRWAVASAALLLVFLCGTLCADEIDDLLAKRQNNVAHLKKLKAEYTVETDRPAMRNEPARTVKMKYSYTLKLRDRNHPDPARRFDVDLEMQEPLQMHIKLENGEFSYLTASGKWVTRAIPPQAEQFMKDLADRHASDPASQREHFNIRRIQNRDSFFGGKKGLEFVPKGKANLYERREEIVDSETGQAFLVEHFDDKGKVKWRMKVNKYGKHNGVVLPEDSETESYGPAGLMRQRTRMDKVEVETE